MVILYGQKGTVARLRGHIPYKEVGHCSALDDGYHAGVKAKIQALMTKLFI